MTRSDWLFFVASRFPEYGVAFWLAYIEENGLDDRCHDEGHEFWCRLAEGTCRRRGPMTCNETPEEAASYA